VTKQIESADPETGKTDSQSDARVGESFTDDDILADARKFYELSESADGNNRSMAVSDLKFLAGDHWDPQSRIQRTIDGRPCLTINTLPTYLHQVTNDQRQNKPGIKIHPVDDGADEETAKVFQGAIRHIEYDSNADVAYDTAVNHAAAIGFGYFRWMPEFEGDDSFDQVIRFKRIRNPLSVRFDPLSTEPDGSDQKRCIIESKMSRAEFKQEYPNASACNWPLGVGVSYPGWMGEDFVLVCEYYRIESTDATLCLLADGSTCYKDEVPKGAQIVKERPSKKQKVMWYKITGCDILERTEILCKWIPVFPVYGDELDIEGRVIRSGLVRNAKDPALMYDYWMTSATEEVALRPKTPFIGAVGQFETAKGDWMAANNKSFSFIEYDAVTVDGVIAPPPQRQPMADIPSGMLAMAMHASDNVKKTTGLFDASLGAQGTATSGIQERAQQHQGDVANFHYTDNLMRTIRHCGRTLVYSFPKYYDAERTVRILGDDDSADYATINQPNVERKPSKDGQVREILNNVSAGTYDVTVSTGPGYATLRQEAAENMAANIDKNPGLWQVFGDLYVKAQDWPGSEEIAERIRKTIPPQLLDDPDEEQNGEMIQTPHGPLPVSQAPQAIAGMEQHIQMLTQQLEGQQKEAQSVQEEKANVMAQKSALDAQQKVMKAEYDRMAADIGRMKAELHAEVATLDANDERVKNEIVTKFRDFEISMVQAVDDFKKTDAQQDASEGDDAQPDQRNDEALLAVMTQMHAEAQQTMQAALAAIAESRQPKQISITAPSGQVYTGVSQ